MVWQKIQYWCVREKVNTHVYISNYTGNRTSVHICTQQEEMGFPTPHHIRSRLAGVSLL